MSERTIVTAALPYANGSIHIGHLVEYLMTDIHVRALKLAGEDALYICADDTHGTPIELAAQKAGVTPEAHIARFAKEHLEDFTAFDIQFDSFHSTNSEENKRWVHEIYGKLKEGGHIEKRAREQLYDEKAGRFLPDRFVKGTCPRCKTEDQYGDVCENCKATYEPTDLIDPYSVVTGTKPVLRSSEHLFVHLKAFEKFLDDWVHTEGRLQPETARFVDEWIKGGLQDWCISRDVPYFGFEIPDEPGKYFYVWLDAPVGYISSTEAWAKKNNTPQVVNEVWREGRGKVVHVIGKDIVYFHTLFWPAMLHAAGLTVPDKVHVHGMLTVDGKKMSKSRGTFINASVFRTHVDPIYLRYYLAAKLGPSQDDVDLSFKEIVDRVNAELVNKLANLVSRSVAFLADKLDGQYAKLSDEDLAEFQKTVQERATAAEAAYRSFDSAAAVREAVALAEQGNKLFQDNAPWKMIKEDPEAAKRLVTICLNLARASTVLLYPALPAFARKVYPMLGLQELPSSFEDAARFDLQDRPVGPRERIVERVTAKAFNKIIEASKPADAAPEKTEKKAEKKSKKKAPETPEVINYDQFMQVDLRVGLVVKAELVEGADKLLRLTVDLGEEKPRNIFAGLRSAYGPEDLQGKKVAVVANLAPRKMRFGMSEGMVLAAGPGGKDLWVVNVSDDAKIGSRIQ